MYLRITIERNKVLSDSRKILTIEGVPNRVNSLFPVEYYQNFKPGRYLSFEKLGERSSIQKIAMSYYLSEGIINRIVSVANDLGFTYRKEIKEGFPVHIYWKRIAESQYNEVVQEIFDRVKSYELQ